MSTYGEDFARANRLTAKQVDALEEIRDGGYAAIGLRTLHSLAKRGLIEYADGEYRISGHGLNVLMANS